jgi:hypothetical protein
MDQAKLDAHLEAIREDGYTVLEGAIAPDLREALRTRVREIETETVTQLEPGHDDESSFLRTAGLLRLDPLFWRVPADEEVLQVVEGVLGPDFLLSTFSAIDVQPKRPNRQPLHPDDALIPLGRPREKAIGCTCMWVITDFNAYTGGTRLLPGSQRDPLDLLWSQDEERMKQVIQPDIPAGSVLVFDHALFHGAADNHSDEWRLGLQVSYHAGWIRPYTNWFRSIPIEEVAGFPQRLQDLLGYKTYHGIGSMNAKPGSYRESYTGKGGRPREPRLPIA